MAITGTRRRGRAIPATSVPVEPELAALPPEPLPIGLPDVNVTSCPICARPITVGTSRCPGCRTRLLLGVPARRAGTFLAIGLALGLGLGAVATATTIGLAGRVASVIRPSATPGVPAVGSTSPSPSLAPTGSASPQASRVPGQAAAALGQAVVVTRRLAARTAELRAELAAKPIDTFAIATSLRGLAADSVVGSGAVRAIAIWPDAAATARRLGDYYALVASTATATLAASLTDEPAYRDGASAMIDVLAGLGPLAAEADSLAAGAGIVPPTAPPSSPGASRP
jgi:hypothetical protein